MSDTNSSENSIVRLLRTNDAAMVAGGMFGIWVLFTLIAVVLGYNANGIVSTLQRVTFLSAVYALAVLALNLHWGYAGLFNIGVAGFMAVGVYTSVMLTASPAANPPGLGLPLPVGIIGGMLASALVGLIAGLPALRLRADYLAIVTVAVSEIIRLTYNSSTFAKYTGGASGFSTIPPGPMRNLYLTKPGSVISDPTAIGAVVFGVFDAFGLSRATAIDVSSTALILVVVLLVYLLLARVGNSPFGRVLKAIREDEVAAQSLGKNTPAFKLKTFMLGCSLMGLAGIMWFGSIGQGSVYPSTFRPELTFYIFIALIIGGAGSNTGSVLGGALFASILFEAPPKLATILQQVLQVQTTPQNLIAAIAPLASGNVFPLVGFMLNNISSLRFVFVGLLLVYLMQRRPEGLLGHRKETAAAVDLSRSTRHSGGESDE